MIENAAAPKHFTTITYVTKDGEKCTATKNNGIVTVQGDKNGVRQVPLDDFMKELAVTLPKVDLARTPNKDTVQFKGGEEKTIPDAKEEAKPNHTVRNWSIGLGSVAALIGLGIAGRRGHLGSGLQKLLGGAEKDAGKLADDLAGAAEHTNPHVSTSAEEISAEEFSQIVNREADFVYGGTKAGEEAATAGAKAEAPKVEAPKAEAPKPEAPKADAPKAEAPKPKTPETESLVTPRSKYPIPESEVLELPKDLELDPVKIIKMGEVSNKLSERVVAIPAENGITRTYTLTYKGSIKSIYESVSGSSPFRVISFKDGKPFYIRDLTAEGARIRFLPKEKPAQAPAAKPKAPKAEAPAAKPAETVKTKENEINRLRNEQDEIIRRQEQEAENLRRQREQDEMATTDIINTAIIADLMSNAGKKTVEKAGGTASKGVDKMVEQLAKQADKAAEATAKADVPKAGSVVEEVIPSVAGKAENTAVESMVTNGEKAADDLFTPNLAHEADSFHPAEIAEAPKTSYFDDAVDEFGMPKSSLLDDTVDEFGIPKIESYGDDLASYDSGLTNPIDDFSSMNSSGGDFFGM